jgi:predicted transcriptional regulator
MTDTVVTVNIEATVKEAVEILNEKHCHYLIVMENESPVGIITERDILKKVIPTCKDPKKMKVQHIMSRPLVVGNPQMELPEAAKIMLERGIKNLPIVHKEKLVGIVTLSDIVCFPDSMEWFKELPVSQASNGIKKVIDTYFDLERLGRKCPLIIEQGYPKKCRKAECMWWIEEDCAIALLSKQINKGRAEEIIENFY